MSGIAALTPGYASRTLLFGLLLGIAALTPTYGLDPQAVLPNTANPSSHGGHDPRAGTTPQRSIRVTALALVIHPLIIGELACGTPPSRAQTLTDLASLQPARQASTAEVLAFIDREHLFGLGCGIVDMHLLASTLITQGVRLWTLDKRLDMLAERFGVAHRIGAH